jgi:hypothetical protein
VPGLGATICPFPPPMTDPLLPEIITKFLTYLKNLIRVHLYAFMEQVFVPYKSRYKMGKQYLQSRFIFDCFSQLWAGSTNLIGKCFQISNRRR